MGGTGLGAQFLGVPHVDESIRLPVKRRSNLADADGWQIVEENGEGGGHGIFVVIDKLLSDGNIFDLSGAASSLLQARNLRLPSTSADAEAGEPSECQVEHGGKTGPLLLGRFGPEGLCVKNIWRGLDCIGTQPT